jgi:hypothetical protein
MVPLPVDVSVIVPLPVFIVPASAIDELLPLSVIDTAPLVANPPVPTVTVAELALSVNDTDAGLFVVLEIDTAVLVSVRVTAAVVFNDTVPADVTKLAPPIAPAPADVFTRFNVPVVSKASELLGADIVPVPVDVSVIVPEPVLIAP